MIKKTGLVLAGLGIVLLSVLISLSFYKKPIPLSKLSSFDIAQTARNKVMKSADAPLDSVASISNPQGWHYWSESKYWVSNGKCTGTFRREKAVLELIFKQVHYEITEIVDKSNYPASVDKRIWFNDLNNLNVDCENHPAWTHAVRSDDYQHRGGAIDITYFTFKDNCTQGRCVPGDDQRIRPEKIYTEDKQVDHTKYDWLRNVLLWRRLLQVYPRSLFMVDVRLVNFTLNALSNAIHYQNVELMKKLGLDMTIHNSLKRRIYADSPENYNHHTHAHVVLSNTDWDAFKTPDWYLNTDWYPLSSCTNEYCEGQHELFFPVWNRSNMLNCCPAKCKGKFWADVRNGHWDSYCSTGWELVRDCTYLGKKLDNCPMNRPKDPPFSVVSCVNNACAGTNSGIYPITNNSGKTTDGKVGEAQRLCCKGNWYIDVRGESWHIDCESGESWVTATSSFFGSMMFPRCP